MSVYSLELPNELLAQVQQLAAEKQLSLEQWMLLAISEKVKAEQSFAVMRAYASRANDAAFEAVMAKVPDVPPMVGDEL
ncbi:CopG family transcriptional regulator [Alkalinema sp. FACHB-956]|uniref:CopG family transcriptional regulator n=1 Tax=Alkalinema sp. FACHB-956 TaxID=2692768 RepID=UPI001689E6A7|nr:CopG family transcriptional regulator [Alkalinema sp. FACHB-956]MBD2326718.1 CopG family transcriptional regulator [Alkalinema sp. FACHB-956]